VERIQALLPEDQQAGVVARWKSVHQLIFDQVESLDF
jgi:hypothetical protein